MAPRMAKSKKWIFQSMKSTICGRSIIASLQAIFSVRAVERITGSLQLTVPPGPDTHHSVGACWHLARLQAATWTSLLVPTIALLPSRRSGASSTACNSAIEQPGEVIFHFLRYGTNGQTILRAGRFECQTRDRMARRSAPADPASILREGIATAR